MMALDDIEKQFADLDGVADDIFADFRTMDNENEDDDELDDKTSKSIKNILFLYLSLA